MGTCCSVAVFVWQECNLTGWMSGARRARTRGRALLQTERETGRQMVGLTLDVRNQVGSEVCVLRDQKKVKNSRLCSVRLHRMININSVYSIL